MTNDELKNNKSVKNIDSNLSKTAFKYALFDALNPKNVFTMYEKGFKNKYIKEGKIGAKAVHIIELYPLAPKTKDYNTIRLYIDKNLMQVVKSEIIGNNGNLYTYDIKKFTVNETTVAGFFTFSKTEFPGFEVNDLR
jgi:outer membrane lipoprotein-sorting protein